jgi:hypothetical protein
MNSSQHQQPVGQQLSEQQQQQQSEQVFVREEFCPFQQGSDEAFAWLEEKLPGALHSREAACDG